MVLCSFFFCLPVLDGLDFSLLGGFLYLVLFFALVFKSWSCRAKSLFFLVMWFGPSMGFASSKALQKHGPQGAFPYLFAGFVAFQVLAFWTGWPLNKPGAAH
jgi:hypothetical protein